MIITFLQPIHARLNGMQATIDLPDNVFAALETRAAQQGSSVQALILQAIEKEIAQSSLRFHQRQRVQLPLIHSRQPGSLSSLTNAEIDALLG
jgi:predicted DNA-binding ribbon-helix-helix protein